MPEDSVGDDLGATPRSFEEWVENVAESEGVSEEEVLDRMVSSYWILQELTGLMAESNDPSSLTDDNGSQETDAFGAEDSDLSNDEFERLIEVAEVLSQGAPSSKVETEGMGADASLRSEIDRLHDDIERLTTRIDNLVDSDRIGGQRPPRPTESQGALGSASVSQDDLDELSDALSDHEDRLDELESRHQEERQRVRENFGHIDDILQYLVGQMDTLDERVDEATDRLTAIGSDDIDRDRLAEIKRTANERGIDEATCERCSQRVDLSLLERAECPSCDHPFDELSSESSWFGLFESHILTLASPENRKPEMSSTDNMSDKNDWDNVESSDESPADVLADLSSDAKVSEEGSKSDDDTPDDFMWNIGEE